MIYADWQMVAYVMLSVIRPINEYDVKFFKKQAQ